MASRRRKPSVLDNMLEPVELEINVDSLAEETPTVSEPIEEKIEVIEELPEPPVEPQVIEQKPRVLPPQRKTYFPRKEGAASKQRNVPRFS